MRGARSSRPAVRICTVSRPVLPVECLPDDRRGKRTAFFRTRAKPVAVQNGIWGGAETVIFPGLAVGENAVAGAGGAANRDNPAGAAGSPCRVIRRPEGGTIG